MPALCKLSLSLLSSNNNNNNSNNNNLNNRTRIIIINSNNNNRFNKIIIIRRKRGLINRIFLTNLFSLKFTLSFRINLFLVWRKFTSFMWWREGFLLRISVSLIRISLLMKLSKSRKNSWFRNNFQQLFSLLKCSCFTKLTLNPLTNNCILGEKLFLYPWIWTLCTISLGMFNKLAHHFEFLKWY